MTISSQDSTKSWLLLVAVLLLLWHNQLQHVVIVTGKNWEAMAVTACLWSAVALYILQLVAVFVTWCVFHCVCVSLWGLRSYSITYVNVKFLYIGRESDVIVTCFVGAFVSCMALRVEWGVKNWYRWLVSNGTCFSELRESNLFMAKVHTVIVDRFAGYRWKK
jgi:hypothetical protein